MKNPALMYRESAVRGASPVGLIVILYEEIIRSLRKAQKALKHGQIEQRTHELTHVIEVIGYLQSILDFDKGGAIALQLSTFYNFARTQVVDANAKSSDATIEALVTQFSAMRSQWQQVENAANQMASEQTAPADARAALRLAPAGAQG